MDSIVQTTEAMATFLLTIILVFVCVIYIKLKRIYTYWERRGVSGPKPYYVIGNYKSIILKQDSLTSLIAKIYNQYPDERYVGIYHGLTPTLVIRDPGLIKKIIVADFSSFADRGFKVTEGPLSRNLFSEDGDKWKILRKTLTPMFSASKLKKLMPLFNSCAKDLIKHTNIFADTKTPEEIRNLTSKFTMKCITCCTFGLDVDSFSDEGKVFVDVGHKIFGSSIKSSFIRLLDSIVPGLPVLLRLHTENQEVTDFFLKLVRTMCNEKEKRTTKQDNLMDILINMKNCGLAAHSNCNGGNVIVITDAFMAAQAALFFAAGYETSSGAMSFLLYELALNPSIQDICYEEVKRVMEKYDRELTYESLKEFEYLSMALAEAMRKHAGGGFLMRHCVNDYKVLNSSLIIEKGTKILVPVFGIQNDPKYYPDPEKFDPERFACNGKNIHDCTYIPFGDGPRNCIGMRFGTFQSIVGIAHFLYNFRVEPSERTPKRITYDPEAIVISSKDGVWLNIKRR